MLAFDDGAVAGIEVATARDGDRSEAMGHRPVLLREVLEALAPRPGGTYVDATFGGGGYSRALFDAGAGRVVGLDRDPEAVARGQRLERERPGFVMLEGRFGELEHHLEGIGADRLAGLVLDLGASSMQLDDPKRGFSFAKDGPLDMRMGPEGESAADVVARASEAELADIFWRYGEERAARRIARAIVARRAQRPFVRTRDLAELIGGLAGGRTGRVDPATRAFQALRIHVNDELGELDRVLAAAERLLAPGGRLAVVAFHSLEDRLVKRFLAERSGRTGGASRHRPEVAARAPSFRLVTRQAVRPGPAEVEINPRARSARLRAAERLGPA